MARNGAVLDRPTECWVTAVIQRSRNENGFSEIERDFLRHRNSRRGCALQEQRFHAMRVDHLFTRRPREYREATVL
jgi:hypothetical protein